MLENCSKPAPTSVAYDVISFEQWDAPYLDATCEFIFFIALINTVVPLFDSSNLRRSYSDCLQYKNIRSKPRHTENESITFIIWKFSPPFSLSIDATIAWVGVIWLAYSLIYCSIELFVKRKPQIQRNKSIKPNKKNIIPSCWLLAANMKHL